jgi:hypothetical protein
VLDALRGSDQSGILGSRIAVAGDRLLAFLDQPAHRVTRLARAADTDLAEDVLEPLDVVLRLVQVVLEGFTELLIRCCLRHLRQRLHQLLFGVVEILELVSEYVL